MTIPRERKTVDIFVGSMIESIRFFAKGRIPEDEIRRMAEYEVNRLDFNNDWQMHKGLGYFAMNAVNRYLSKADHFGEAMQDGRLTSPSDGKIYCLREAIKYSDELGRPLTEEEMKRFEERRNSVE